MLSRTSEYALQAVAYLAQNADHWPVTGRKIADDIHVPRKYLSSILRTLVRAGVLAASPGRSGGFRLARVPKSIRLAEVLAPFESAMTSASRCPFGYAVCEDDEPCAGLERWKHVKHEYEAFLVETSVYDVVMRKRCCRKYGR